MLSFLGRGRKSGKGKENRRVRQEGRSKVVDGRKAKKQHHPSYQSEVKVQGDSIKHRDIEEEEALENTLWFGKKGAICDFFLNCFIVYRMYMVL